MDKIKNPYTDLPVTVRRVLCSVVSATAYLLEVLSAILLGGVLFGMGKKTDKKRSFYHRYIHIIYRFNTRFMPGVKYHIENKSNETFRKGAIMICNHQSFLDSVCLLILSPKILIVTGDKVWQNRIIHKILSFADFYPISRGIENSIPVFEEYIGKGYSIAIFPEGEQSQTCSILRFHRGAFYLAEQLKSDILPVFIHGVGHVLPKGCHWINNGAIFIEIGQRITPEDTQYGENYPARTKNIRHYYRSHYKTLCHRIETAHYFNNCIVSLYGHLGLSVQRKVSRLFNRHAGFSKWVDISYDEETLIILNDEYGAIGLLFALVHPDKQIITTDNHRRLRALMHRCKSLPKNIEPLGETITDFSLLKSAKIFVFKPTLENALQLTMNN